MFVSEETKVDPVRSKRVNLVKRKAKAIVLQMDFRFFLSTSRLGFDSLIAWCRDLLSVIRLLPTMYTKKCILTKLITV